MDGERSEEMNLAWLRYLVERGDSKGWNPRLVFEAGWSARGGEPE